jgi:hypothetical protein
VNPLPDFRAQRGEAIAQIAGAVRRIDDTSYIVRSQSGNGEYHLVSGENGGICPCPDARFRGVKCTSDRDDGDAVYFSGLSFASTSKALRLKGVKVSSVSVYKWVKKICRADAEICR